MHVVTGRSVLGKPSSSSKSYMRQLSRQAKRRKTAGDAGDGCQRDPSLHEMRHRSGALLRQRLCSEGSTGSFLLGRFRAPCKGDSRAKQGQQSDALKLSELARMPLTGATPECSQ